MLLDELMPSYDAAARYQTIVKADAARTFSVLQHVDFSQSGVIRLLMGIRTLGRRARHKPDPNQSLTERIRRAGFMEVSRLENEELVIGVVGRFWQPSSGIIQGLSPKEIIDFQTDGYAKALWNFHLASTSPGETRLSTETRIQTFGAGARRRFLLYWSVVGPFSGWIRKEMLRLIRTQAEQ
ncbi:MAG TPA: hypothetical protein VK699_12265 [Terriglobales bacterium]|jgi:hypothetical protein|nr:hypothetical protein [Terriglobales bacterium]